MNYLGWLKRFASVGCAALALSVFAADNPFSTNTPKARVVIVQDAAATEAFRPQPERVQALVDRGIVHLTGKKDAVEAWQSLVSSNDVVGLKVCSTPGPNSGTRPAVVEAVIKGLLASGLPASNLIIWDKHTVDLRLAGFFEFERRYGVRVAGAAQAGFDEKVFYDAPLLGNLLWGDLEFGKKGEGVGRKSFVSKLLTQQITKIININPLLNHNAAGVSGNLYGLAMSSVDNTFRFEQDSSRLATAVPDIYNLPPLGEHVVLNIVDALICQYEGGQQGLLHYSATLNQLRFSRDPVALDVLSVQELEQQRLHADAPVTKPNRDLYEFAALLELGVSDLKKIQVDNLK